MRTLPALIHVRARDARTPEARTPEARTPEERARPSAPPSRDDVSARTLPLDVLRRELQSGALPRDTEVLFTGIEDWTAAHEIPELWVAPSSPAPSVGGAPDVPASEPVAASEQRLSAPNSEPRRRNFGALGVLGALLGAVALLGVGAAAIYLVYFHYKPVAVQHLPRRCVAAARVDFVDFAFFDPLSKKIAPAIEEATKPPPPVVAVASGPSLKERLKALANVDIDRGEIREVALCVFQDTTLPGGAKDPLFGYRAVVALGGRFKSGIIPGLFEALRPELAPLAPRLDGGGESAVIRVLPSPASGGIGFVIGQAEDGTLLVAPNDAALASAREQRSEEDARATTNLRQKGAFELSLEHFVFGAIFRYEALGAPPPALEQVFKALGDVQVGYFGLQLGKSPRIDLSLEEKTEGAAKDVEGALRKVVELGNKELATASKDWAGEHGAVGGARVLREDTRVDLKLDFRYSDVDRGAGDFAEQIKDPASPFRMKTVPLLAWRLGLGPAPAPPPGSASGAPSGSPSGVPPKPEDL